jgi:hypothetical protein
MDESIDFWSTPWQILQRDLAQRIRVPDPMQARPRVAGAGVPALGANWLARARAPGVWAGTTR